MIKPNFDYIKPKDLKEGWLYKIRARNFRLGIWFKDKEGFLGRREKFTNVYTFTEIHYDLSDFFGTAFPIEEIERSPFTIEDLKYVVAAHRTFRPKERELLDYLEKKELDLFQPNSPSSSGLDIGHPRK